MAFSKRKIIFGVLGATIATGIAIVNGNKSDINETAPEKPQEKQTVIKVKLGTKYQKALINDEMNFWKSRFEELKIGNPKHKDLLEIQKLITRMKGQSFLKISKIFVLWKIKMLQI